MFFNFKKIILKIKQLFLIVIIYFKKFLYFLLLILFLISFFFAFYKSLKLDNNHPLFIKYDKFKTEKIKGLIYYYKWNNFFKKFIYRKKLFLWNNKILDKEGFVFLNENINNNLILISNYNFQEEKEYILIFNKFKKFCKKKKYSLKMYYLGYRWNLYFYKKNKYFIIKLPENIQNIDKKIDFFFRKWKKIKKYNCIDMIYENKIFLTNLDI